MDDPIRRTGAPPSHVRSLLRLGLARLRERSSPTPRPQPRRRPAVDRDGIPIDARRVRRYLEVTRGHDLDWDAAGGPIVPPAYPALWETALMLELMLERGGGLPRGSLVHLESELVQLRPLHVGERVRCRTELDAEARHARGTLLRIVSRNWNARAQLCSENTVLLLAREPTPARAPRGGSAASAGGAAEAEAGADWSELEHWRLAGSDGRRYARVSGDFNPIHLWPWTSRLFGYRRPILHGYCIEALVAHALVRHRLGGRPAALRRLQIRFRAPLLLPGAVRLQVRGRDFRVAEAEGRGRVLCAGSWTGAAPDGAGPA